MQLLIDDASGNIASGFTRYKKKVQKFLEERLVEQTTEEEEKTYAVVIDESISNEIPDLTHLHNRVKLILGHKNLALVRWDDLTMNPLKHGKEETVSTTLASGQQITAAQNNSIKALQRDSVTESQSCCSSTTISQNETSVSICQNDDASVPYPREQSSSSGNCLFSTSPSTVNLQMFFTLDHDRLTEDFNPLEVCNAFLQNMPP